MDLDRDYDTDLHTEDEIALLGRISNIHSQNFCQGRVCVVHSPTPHGMRYWPISWRSDLGIFERACAHGIGHPDPDQEQYFESIGKPQILLHSCDGCCGNAR